MRNGTRRTLAVLLLTVLTGSWLAVAPRSVAAPVRRPDPQRPRIIPDGMPYDSTRGDSVGEASLYLSWGAPWGAPGARRNVDVNCRDTSRVDTLYLSLVTGRDLPHLIAIYARVAIRPSAGDSLGVFWGFGEGGANRGGLLVQMDADDTSPCSQPWLYPGMGGTVYEFVGGAGELLAIYAVKPEDGAPISGLKRYCFARLLLRHRSCALPGSDQPVCIEWREGGYSGGGPDILIRRGENRFVSVNSPNGDVCTPYRHRGKVPAWNPPVQRTAPPRPPRPAAPADSTRR